VEVTVEPAFGLACERHEPETEWPVCQCRKSQMLADIALSPDRAVRREPPRCPQTPLAREPRPV
jgi:hypothetical protein